MNLHRKWFGKGTQPLLSEGEGDAVIISYRPQSSLDNLLEMFDFL
ncbi:hypothetical protein PP1Y_Mpl8410 (plasmid) [Novosphingobium sp. PP1Y]|nr:hypothetical protein PP1Y_Mpl8410 [Novosphingobium sp. PP1Y]